MNEELRAALTALKDGAEPKLWNDRPKDPVTVCGYFLTCCIENGQLVLGVSVDGDPLPPSQLFAEIVAVFGEPPVMWEAHFPRRGQTTLYCWPPRPEEQT
jgi:hypothetical protein